MKKSLLKNLIALAFSLGALAFMAGNVFADHTLLTEEEGEIGDGTKYCAVPGAFGYVYAYRCDDPGSHTLPPYKCGTPKMIRSATRTEQCWQ